MSTARLYHQMIGRALNDPYLASNAAAELMNLVARKSRSRKKSKKVKTGTFLGIIIGIIIFIIILYINLFLVRKRAQKKRLQDGEMQSV